MERWPPARAAGSSHVANGLTARRFLLYWRGTIGVAIFSGPSRARRMAPLRGHALEVVLKALDRGVIPAAQRDRALALVESFPPDRADPQVLVVHGLLTQKQLDQLLGEPAASARGDAPPPGQSKLETVRQLPGDRSGAGEAPAGRRARCPKCGHRFEVDPAAGQPIVCPVCQAALSLPGKADPLIGQTLGQFEIVGLLGRGGMGAVYKARQASLDRLVALKVLPHRVASDSRFIERFNREAHAAAAVNHPHIVPIYDFGQDKGFYYIAMELVEGESLKQVLDREGPLPAGRALDLLRQVASALSKAHAAGIVHRDIKPGNILVTPDGHAKVADFGLAKRPACDTSVTQSGALLGTPLYFPPESARGEAFDARSDLYSLGATFYHLLAGRPPFDGDNPVELAMKHAEKPVPSLQELAPTAPVPLCRVIHRLVRKSPAERYPSAEDLLEALKGVDAQPPVSRSEATLAGARGPSRPAARQRLEARKRSRRTALLAAAVAALGLIALAIILLRGGGATSPQAEAPADPGTATDAAPQKKPPPPSTASQPTRTPAVPKATTTKEDEQWGEWEDLFDGKSTKGWEVLEGGIFVRNWSAHVDQGRLIIEAGNPYAGIAVSGEFPSDNYEVALEAMRVDGKSEFATLNFPIGASRCNLNIASHASGNVVGLNHVDDRQVQMNETLRTIAFVQGRWYRIRVRVTIPAIQVWIDDEKIVDIGRAGHTFRPSDGYPPLSTFAVASYATRSALGNIRLRRLKEVRTEVPAPGPVLHPDRWKPGEWVSLFDGKTLAGWQIGRAHV